MAPSIPPAASEARHVLYETHAARVMVQSAWALAGRVSISSEQESWQASVQWRQWESEFEILLQGPLGQGSLRLRSSQGAVVLETSDGQRQVDASAEQLVYQHLGVMLPLEKLRFWVRGVAAPAIPAVMEWDDHGQLQRLQQEGWDIRYKSYMTTAEGLPMPVKLFIAHAPWQVKVMVDNWSEAAAPLPVPLDTP